MSRVEIPVEAKLNAGDIDAELKELTQKINALGQSIANANKIKFNPITKASMDDLKRVQDAFEKLKRTSQLGVDINRTGQGGKSFFDLDWSTIASNNIAREARRYGAFNMVMAGTGASFTQPSPGPNSAPPPSTPSTRKNSPGVGSTGGSTGGGSPWGNAGRKIVGSGLKAVGPVGGVADEAIGAGMSGGVMAGMAGLLGGVVALGVGKLVGGIVNKIGDAQNDMIGYDTLKRSLGDVNVSFSVLRESMHKASDAFDGTYQQTLKMGMEFARISGMSGKGSELALAQEVAVGGGFGRAFGTDPEQSSAFFAMMKQFQVTGSGPGTDMQSRRMALYLAEAIQKSGTSAKTDEILQAIASYTTQQTRMGLASANVNDYTALLAGMAGSKIPGLDVMGSASLLSRVNSAVSSGGNAGEAGQNFTYMALGRPLGLDPIQAAILREQGAFGTGAQAFGDDSLYRRWAAQYHMSAPGAAGASGTTNLQNLMARFHSTYRSNPELMLNAMSNYFGINTSQAMALDTVRPDQLGGLAQALHGAGVDLKQMNPSSIAALAKIANGSASDLNSATSDIWGKLDASERGRLNSAVKGGNQEAVRSELLKDYAKYGQAQTDGEQTRKTIQDLDKDMQDKANLMIGPLNDMRQILLYAFGDRGKMSAADITKANYIARYNALDQKRKDAISSAESAHSYGLSRGAFGKNLGVENPELVSSNKAAIAKATAEANAQFDKDHAALNQELYPTGPGGVTPGGVSSAGAPMLPVGAGGGGVSSSGGAGRVGGAAPSDSVMAAFRAKFGPMAARIADGIGADPNAVLAQIADETNWGRNVVGNNPLNIHKSTNWTGATIMRGDTDANGNSYQAPFKAYDNLMDAADDAIDTYRRMDPGVLGSGTNIDQFTGGLMAGHWAENPAYASGIKGAYARLTGTPMPDIGSASSGTAGPGGTQSYSFDHNITLWNPNGTQAAPTTTINTSFASPVPFGN